MLIIEKLYTNYHTDPQAPLFSQTAGKRKPPSAYAEGGLTLNRELTMTYSHMGEPTLPLAQRCFTSEFGKGSGEAIALLSSAKKVRYDFII